MSVLRPALVVLALVAASACGAGRATSSQTTAGVAALLRSTWGATIGSRSFEYSCRRLDEHGQLFTCSARDRTGLVRLASFDVVCRRARCSWTAYPSYDG